MPSYPSPEVRIEPLGFTDYVRLQQAAHCVLSDSGTVSEEAALLGFPAVTTRDAIERPEAVDSGAIVLSGLDADNVVEAIRHVTRPDRPRPVAPVEYLIDDCSARVVGYLLSTWRRHAAWSGLRQPKGDHVP